MKTNNENKKAVIFARVSTEAQDYTEQVNRMTAVAIADGYSRNDLVVISNKESAIKLSEDEREGLQQLQSAITSDSSINAVYVFEISRLGRRMDVISSVVQWLTDSRIQLVCDTPNVRLFERDGSVSFGGQMMIYLMGVMAAQEMKIKKERFANGKKRAKEQGKWIGTPVMFGYKIVNQREVINEVAAEVIRKAYKMYAGDINRTAQTNIDIAMYLRNNGICKRSDKFFSAGRVASFISREKYRGTIVSEELWDRCNEIRLKNYNGSKERKQAFGERLIKCQNCGRNYKLSHRNYICAAHKAEYKESDMYCDNTVSLHRRFVDCSLVETVAVWWFDEQKKDNSERQLQAMEAIEKLNARLADAQGKLDKVAELQNQSAEIIEVKTWQQQWQSFKSLTHTEMYEAIHRLVEYVCVRVENDKSFWTIHRKDSSDEATYMLCGHGRAVKLYGYINDIAVELTGNPAFNVEYEKDQVKVYWLRKDLSTLPDTMPVTCPTTTTASNISCLGHDFASI